MWKYVLNKMIKQKASFTNCFPFILKAGRLSYLFSSIDSIIQTVFQSVLFIFAGIQIAVGNMTVGEFVMINSYFALLLRAVKYYTAIYKQYQDSLASYKRMRAILAYPKILNGEIEINLLRIQLPKDFYETNQEFVSSLELSGFSLEALQKNAYLDRDLYSYAVNLKIDS